MDYLSVSKGQEYEDLSFVYWLRVSETFSPLKAPLGLQDPPQRAPALGLACVGAGWRPQLPSVQSSPQGVQCPSDVAARVPKMNNQERVIRKRAIPFMP